MAFKNLEDAIQDTHLLPYLDLFGNLQEPTRTTLGYALDIGAYLHNIKLDSHYALFGGYAVLSHLMTVHGEQFAKVWRGSTDIDMVADKSVLSALRAGYTFNSCLMSPNIDNKATIKLTTSREPECRIDYSIGDPEVKFFTTHENTHFGVPLHVAGPTSIIYGKLATPLAELQHTGDIIAMLHVLEQYNQTPHEVAERFLKMDKAEDLHHRITQGKREFAHDRLGLFPTDNYLKQLQDELSVSISETSFHT